jgi:hypothetical protein
MAEPFSVFTGAASLLTLLSTIIDVRNSCKRIKSFEADRETHRLSLEHKLIHFQDRLEKLCASRANTIQASPGPDWSRVDDLAASTCQHILQLSQEAIDLSLRYHASTTPATPSLAGDSGDSAAGEVSWVKWVKWALWAGKDLENLIETTGKFITDLQNLVSIPTAGPQGLPSQKIATLEEMGQKMPHGQIQSKMPTRTLPNPEGSIPRVSAGDISGENWSPPPVMSSIDNIEQTSPQGVSLR